MGLFRVLRALLTYIFALVLVILIIAFRIAIARYYIVGVGTLVSNIRGNAPNTSIIGTKPSSPKELLIAFTTIYRQASFNRHLELASSSLII